VLANDEHGSRINRKYKGLEGAHDDNARAPKTPIHKAARKMMGPRQVRARRPDRWRRVAGMQGLRANRP